MSRTYEHRHLQCAIYNWRKHQKVWSGREPSLTYYEKTKRRPGIHCNACAQSFKIWVIDMHLLTSDANCTVLMPLAMFCFAQVL